MFLLRWRFDFSNHKPTRTGQWGIAHSHEPSKMAAFVNKEHLTRACVEGMNQETGQILIMAECDGHEYVNFKWLAEVRHNDCGTTSAITGLMLVTREQQISVSGTGQIHVEQRPDEDKTFHYEGFGR